MKKLLTLSKRAILGFVAFTITGFWMLDIVPKEGGGDTLGVIAILMISSLIPGYWKWMANQYISDILTSPELHKPEGVTKVADYFYSLGGGLIVFILGLGYRPELGELLLPSTIQQDQFAYTFGLILFLNMCGAMVHVIWVVNEAISSGLSK